MFTEIIKADYISEYKLRFFFNDGVIKIVDFYPIVFVNNYPAFRSLKNIDVFKNFEVTDTLEWDNGNIDIAPETIYELGETESSVYA